MTETFARYRNGRGLEGTSLRGAAFDAHFTRLWQNNVSTAEIGRQLGVSKNVVCGLRYRLNLDPRGTPIKPGVEAPQERPAITFKPVKRLDQTDWLAWFNTLEPGRRRWMARTRHKSGCESISGSALWLCNCGISQPPQQPLAASGVSSAPTIPQPPRQAPAARPEPALAASQSDRPPLEEPDDDPGDDDAEESGAEESGEDNQEEDSGEDDQGEGNEPVFFEDDRVQRCCFPKSHGRGRTIFCDRPVTTARRSYCDECHRNTHMRAPRRDEAELAQIPTRLRIAVDYTPRRW